MSVSYPRIFLRDNLIVLCGVALVYMKGLILMPVIIKTVGVTVYGGFTLLTSMLGIVFGISSFGAGFRARRFLPAAQDMQARGNLFYPQFFFQFASILLFSVLFLILDNQIRIHIFKHEIDYSSLIIPTYLVFYFLYSQGSDYFRYTSRVHYMTIATLVFPYLHIVFILVFYWLYRFLSVNLLMVSQILASILIALPCFWIILRELGLKLRIYGGKDLALDIKLGFPLVLGFIVDFILAGSDRYFIAYYMSVTDVGYYTPGYVLGSLIVFIPKAMGTALPQLLSKAVDSENEYEAQRMLSYAVKIFLLLAIPFIFGSISLGKPILTLLATAKVAENANWVTPIVAAGTLFYGLNILLSNVLYVRMKTNYLFKMNFLAAILNLAANAILLYFFRNLITPAITTLLSYLSVFVYMIMIVKSEAWPVDFHWGVILKSLTASLFMYVLLFCASFKLGEHTSIALLTGNLLLGVSAYICGLFALGTFTKRELQFLRGCVYK